MKATFYSSSAISIHALVKRATTNGIGANICGYISIHALVKRATLTDTTTYNTTEISIHALVKRATFGVRERLIFRQHFNPRPREEGDML